MGLNKAIVCWFISLNPDSGVISSFSILKINKGTSTSPNDSFWLEFENNLYVKTLSLLSIGKVNFSLKVKLLFIFLFIVFFSSALSKETVQNI